MLNSAGIAPIKHIHGVYIVPLIMGNFVYVVPLIMGNFMGGIIILANVNL